MRKAIPSWEQFYEVYDSGVVCSLPRTIHVRNPQGVVAPRTYAARMLKPARLKKGYLMVSLIAPGRKRRYAYVHDLVLEAFVGPKPAGKEACHNNGRPDDNRPCNLRYDTRSANARDRVRHGTQHRFWEHRHV